MFQSSANAPGPWASALFRFWVRVFRNFDQVTLVVIEAFNPAYFFPAFGLINVDTHDVEGSVCHQGLLISAAAVKTVFSGFDPTFIDDGGKILRQPRHAVADRDTSGFDPYFGRKRIAIQAGLVSKGFEFETFECRIVNLFPDTDEFEGVAVEQPLVNQHIVPNFFCHVGQRDEIARVMRNHGNGGPLDIDGDFLGFAHGISGNGKSEEFMRIWKAVQIAIFWTGLVLLNGWILTVSRHRGSGFLDF
jgi:hypothetical protein